jgi:hypothetical protein
MIIPSQLRPGDPLLVNAPDGKQYRATFISRSKIAGTNTLHSDAWKHLDGIDHLGFVQMSDEDLIRQAQRAPEEGGSQ